MIVFLDIDGVLVTWESMRAYHQIKEHHKIPKSEMFNKNSVDALKYLLDFYVNEESKIVISSAWRIKGLSYMREILENAGISNEVIGVTPTHPEGIRGMEILQFIADNKIPSDEKIFVIDDEVVDIVQSLKHLSNVTIINVSHGLMRYGLSKEIVDDYLRTGVRK